MASIIAPGVYNMPAADYHADPCPVPSLSTSAAKLLVDRSPRHAWWAHPRLNPAATHDEKSAFDFGEAAHALLLEGEAAIAVIDAPDWRTKTAKEARDAARANGKIPLLTDQEIAVTEMVTAARAQLARHMDAADALTAGLPEQTLIWREGETWCRARADWLFARGDIDDYKTTSGSAHPDQQGRRLFDLGADLQAAFYRRGAHALDLSDEPRFRFIVQEIEPPYALSVLQLDPAAVELADRKVAAALELWAWCIANDKWPGYPAHTCFIGAPMWHQSEWASREVREQMERDAGNPELFKMLLDWQKPWETRDVV